MAINFGKGKETLFASTDLMSFGKAFSRMAAQPLDMYEVWYDYDALVAYAANTDSATATAYVGQKVAYIDADNKVTHYSIEADGSLKELGTTPVGDNSSIVVDENGTISLKGVDTLVFEREVEGKEEKEEVKFQPLMTKNGLVWVEPSKTTVEGLAVLIEELTGRVKAVEDWKTGLVEKTETGEGSYIEVSVATENGEVKSVSVDDSALANFKTKQTAISNADGSTTKTVTGYTQNENGEVALTYADIAFPVDENTEYHIEYDSDNKKIKLVAGADAGKMEIDATPFIKDGMISSVELVAADAEGKEGQFLKITWNDDGEDVTYVNISELINVEELNAAIEDKADKTELDNYVTNEVYNAHLTTQSEKDAAQDKALNDYKAEMVEILKDYQTTIPAETYDTYGSAAKALADAKQYADDNKVAKVDGYGLLSAADQAKLDKLTLEDGDLTISGSVEAGSVKNLDTWLTTNRNSVAGLYPVADATKLTNIADNAQVNVLEGVQVDGVDLTITGKKVNIELKAISNQADKGVADAATAQSKANSAYTLASENKTALETLGQTVSTNKNAADAIGNRVTTLETTSSQHDTKIANLETNLGKKADQSSLDTLAGTVGTNTGDISSLKTLTATHTTEIADRYTKGEIDSKVTTLNTAINLNAEGINGLKSRVDAIDGSNGAIVTLTNRIAAIDGANGSIATINGQISSLDGRLTTVEGDVSTLKDQIGGLSGAMHFRGVSKTDPMGDSGASLEGIENANFTNGDVVLYDGKEYVYDGSAWHMFGDEGSYALKNNVYNKSEIDGFRAADLTEAKAYVDALMNWTEME